MVENDSSPPRQPEPKSTGRMPEDPRDAFLQHLVTVIESDAGSFGITLTVGGLLISGMACSTKTYFQLFGREFAQGMALTNKEAAASLEESFSMLAGLPQPSPPKYVHLKEARVFHPGGPPVPANQTVLFRCRIDRVDAFTLGSLGSGDEP